MQQEPEPSLAAELRERPLAGVRVVVKIVERNTNGEITAYICDRCGERRQQVTEIADRFICDECAPARHTAAR